MNIYVNKYILIEFKMFLLINIYYNYKIFITKQEKNILQCINNIWNITQMLHFFIMIFVH